MRVPDVQHVPPVVPQRPRLLRVGDALAARVERLADRRVERGIAVLGNHADAVRLGKGARGREAATGGDAEAPRVDAGARGREEGAHRGVPGGADEL